MSRFDQQPDEPYGSCKDCGETLPTRPDLSAHLRATTTNGRSHTARITNQTRAERIESEVQSLADDALDEFTNSALALTSNGDVTDEEITEAMRGIVADFADAWEMNR